MSAVRGTGTGTVYLIHFDRPYRHARHYTGWTTDLEARLALHLKGQGARLMAVIKAERIGWQLARTWPGGRQRERQIKRQGGASRVCPLCGVPPREPRPPVNNSKKRDKAGTASRMIVGTGRPARLDSRGSQAIDLAMTCMTSVYAAVGTGTAPARRRANGHRAGHDGTASTRITEARKAREKRSGPSRGPRTYDNRISVRPDSASPWFGRLVCEAPDTSPQRTVPWVLR